MKELVFPLLSADDIEVRVGQFNKDKTKCTLLLYKTARVDANILDKVVGVYNWQKKFYELKGNIYCSLGIFSEEHNQWIWKDDAGAETQVESEKGSASDAFKRAGFAWGLGRELYSAPTIWVDNPQNYTDFQVQFISYDNNRRIKDVVITAKDKTNGYQVVQLYPKGNKVPQKAQKQANTVNVEDIDVSGSFLSTDKGSATKEQVRQLNTYVEGLTTISHDKFFQRLDSLYGVGSIELLSEEQAEELIGKIFRK